MWQHQGWPANTPRPGTRPAVLEVVRAACALLTERPGGSVTGAGAESGAALGVWGVLLLGIMCSHNAQGVGALVG